MKIIRSIILFWIIYNIIDEFYRQKSRQFGTFERYYCDFEGNISS